MSYIQSPLPRPENSDGIGCRPFTVALGSFIVFSVACVALGLSLALQADPAPWAERLGLALYVAGAPISGVFAALVGELPLAPFTDMIVWIAAAGLIARRSDEANRRVIALTMGAALVFGAVVSLALERV